MHSNEQIGTEFAALAADIRNADPASQDAIVQIGARFEQLFASLEGVPDELGGIIRFAIDVLQAAYGGHLADAPAAMRAVAFGVETAGVFLAGGGAERLSHSVEAMRDALEGRPVELPDAAEAGQAETPKAEGPAVEDLCGVHEGLTIEDLSAMLMGLRPDDAAELSRVRDRLLAIVGEDGFPATAAELAVLAAMQLEQVISGRALDAEAALASAAQQIGQAVEEKENAELAAEAEQPAGTPDQEAASSAAVAEEPASRQASEPAAEAPAAPAAEAKPRPAAEAAEQRGPTILPEDADLDLLKEFIVECLDHLTGSEGALLELESNPEDVDKINVVFRAFHTIKGTSGFLGLDRIQKLAHLAENLLDRCRDGEIRITGGYADLALRSCDQLRAMIEGLEGIQPGDETPMPEKYWDLLEVLKNPEAAGVSEEDSFEPMRVGDILVGQEKADRQKVEEAASRPGPGKIGEKLVESGAATAEDVAKAIRTQKKQGGGVQTESTIRVGTGRLDSLINMVGELVIAHSMVAQDPMVTEDTAGRLGRSVSHSGKIIRELQDLTMSLRMVPLKGTFQKMARLVRDLARKSGKTVQFVTEGEETEIDRNMVEVLNDPLVHMIRNAVDHGIEPTADRLAAGKSETGTVTLRAYHSAGNVVIELTDDGKGLNRERILAKAVERGLVDAGKELTDNETFQLIFQPGFSTAEKVTDVSGRGVGMDVVRKNIDSLRGRIDVGSKMGQGSTFSLRLPLTMAITDAMLLRVGEERYLLPVVSIEQSFRPEDGAISTVTGKGEVVQLRGELLPVHRLHELFAVPGAIRDPYEGLLIVIEGEGKRCALMADELLGQQQVVIKSLGRTLGQVPGVAGGAILGDGRVGLILDAAGIVELAHTGQREMMGTAA